jgi:hypothetical protein
MIEHVRKCHPLQSKDTKLCEKFLLPNTLPQGATRWVARAVIAWNWLNDRLFVIG